MTAVKRVLVVLACFAAGCSHIQFQQDHEHKDEAWLVKTTGIPWLFASDSVYYCKVFRGEKGDVGPACREAVMASPK